ncbi:MAG: thiamine phosphate synthase [Bradymonadales bacterium]|nr:thiamine phosphate synthase [Bradymonadales bacterium]
MNLRERLRIYLVADYTGRRDQVVEWAVERALAAGVTTVQYRDKSPVSGAVRLERAERLRRLVAQQGALYIVNDDFDLAIQAGADGVHLGPHDLDPSVARRRAPGGLIIGGSAGSVARALELEQAGVDYLGVGAIFDARPTKSDASSPRGPEVIAEIGKRVRIPLVGIGGITAENAGLVFRAGASGVAVVRSVIDAEDPASVVADLLAAAARGSRS